MTFDIAIIIAFHTCTHDSQQRGVRHNLVGDVQLMNETFSPSFFSLRILVKVSLFEKSLNYITVVTEPVRSASCLDGYVIDSMSRRLLTALIQLLLVKMVRKCVPMGVSETASDS